MNRAATPTLLDTRVMGAQIRAMGRTEEGPGKADESRAILLVDHGSRRAEANAMLDQVAGLVRQRLGPASIVECSHMEIAEPTVAQGFARCVDQGATTVVVHPFMLAPGRHVTEDLPRLVAEAARAHAGVTFTMAGPLGSHAGVIDAVIDRCHDALEDDA